MTDIYKELLAEIDKISECKDIKSTTFTYGFIWGKATFARELLLISDDQMAHIFEVADRTFDDWMLYLE